MTTEINIDAKEDVDYRRQIEKLKSNFYIFGTLPYRSKRSIRCYPNAFDSRRLTIKEIAVPLRPLQYRQSKRARDYGIRC